MTSAHEAHTVSEHHLHRRGIRRGQARSFVAAFLGIALAGVGATACAPEPPPALAACPRPEPRCHSNRSTR